MSAIRGPSVRISLFTHSRFH